MISILFQGPEPKQMTAGASGFDLALSEDLLIEGPGGILHYGKTGLHIAVPEGIDCQLRPRSSLFKNTGCIIPNTPGTIDSDYRGEISVPLVRLIDGRILLHRGMRVAQLVFAPLTPVRFVATETLSTTNRGVGGFGSTGS